MRSQFVIFSMLLALWFLLSGHFSVLGVTLGVISVSLTLMLICRMQAVDPWSEPHGAVFYARLTAHFARLIWDMLVSAVRVARLVLEREPKPVTAFMDAPLTARSPLGCLVRANSITLTPGTISTELEDGSISVHVLDRRDDEAEQLDVSDKQVRDLER